MIEVVALRHLPPEFVAVVSESERGGYGFLRRLVDEWVSGQNRFDRSGEGLFAAWANQRLVGVFGLNVDPFVAEVGVGRLRHLYVVEAWRRLGVGRELVRHVLRVAEPRFSQVRLRTNAAGAAAFYERLGFQVISHASATHAWRFAERGAAA